MSRETKKCFVEEFYKESIVALRFHILEELHEEKQHELEEHEHYPVFHFMLTNLDKNEEIETLQGMNSSGRVNFIITESKPKIC